ncbi:MAG TPA: aquaporin [Thermomicrobiales bacterium]|nr:aquaporin [Thermomicrobiales bacterium]
MSKKRNAGDERELLRQAVVEFIGPFALVFIGVGAIISTAGENLIAIALAHGLAIGLLVASAGHISGGVYNPALTIGLLVTGRLPVNRAGVYVVAQLAGATVAALALKAVFFGSDIDAVNLGVPAIAPGFSVGAGILAEAIGTFFLMFAVFGTAVDKRGAKEIAPLVIGLIITIDILAFGAVTGGAVNPSRSFGPALVQGDWTNFWVYWVGPVAGAVGAALLYHHLLQPGTITPEAGRVEIEPTTAQRETPRSERRRRR